MKTTIARLFPIAAIAAVTIAATQLHAAPVPELTVAVPFDFVVSGKTMPAGTYRVSLVTTQSGIPSFIVRNQSTRIGAFAVMGGRAVNSKPLDGGAQVAFSCRAETCYWREIRVPGRDAYVAPLPSITRGQHEKMVALDARFAATGR